MMALPAFADALDRWGGALERWPATARRDAETLLVSSAEARALHDGMAELEAVLRAEPVAIGDPARFASRATRHPQERDRPAAARRVGWGAAVAAALALGLVVGDAGRGISHEDNPAGMLASALDPGAGAADVD